MSQTRKTSEKALEQMAQVHARKRRRVMIEGTVYASLTEAGNCLGVSETVIRKMVKRHSAQSQFLDGEKSALVGRSLSDDSKHKLSLFRKNDQAAKDQLSSIRHLTQKKILLNGVLYDSITAAVKQTGLSEPTIHRELKKIDRAMVGGVYVLNYVRSRKKPNSQFCSLASPHN
jgi:hypothetical protein